MSKRHLVKSLHIGYYKKLFPSEDTMNLINDPINELSRVDKDRESNETQEPDINSDPVAEETSLFSSGPSISEQKAEIAHTDIEGNRGVYSPSDKDLPIPQETTGIQLKLEEIVDGFDRLERKFSALQEYFNSKIRYDESKEKMIDSLHKELQAYRDGLHYNHIRPIVMGLIDLLDDLESILSFQSAQPDGNADINRMRQNIEVTYDSIKSILGENGVVAFSEVSDMFDRRRQRVQRAEPTNDPGLSGKICKRIHLGYEYDKIVLRPEVVSTWKYMPEQEKSESTNFES